MRFTLVTLFIFINTIFAGNVYAAKKLAEVNGKTITHEEVETALSGVNEIQKRDLLKDQKSLKQIVNSIIDENILVDRALKEKLDKTPEFNQAVEMFKKQYLMSAFVEKVVTPKITESNAKNFFKSRKSEFSNNLVRAQHILLESEAEAKKILGDSKKPGADFQKLAEQFSKDPSAKNNRGELGYFTRDRMASEFSDVAFRTKEGQIVGPVKTIYGYHVIKVIDRKFAPAPNYEEVELQVKTALKQKMTKELIDGLRKNSEIKMYF